MSGHDDPKEAARRWRLVLGRYAGDTLGHDALGRDDVQMDLALDSLYGREYEGKVRPQAGGGGRALRLLVRVVQHSAESLLERGSPRGLGDEGALFLRQRQRRDLAAGRASGAGGVRCARRGGRAGAGLERMDGHG